MVVSEQQFSGRTVAGRYRLGPRRGSGIDAAVFDAFDIRERQVVSLQVVHPDISTGTDFRDAFRPTMATAAALEHPHIAKILDVGSDDWNGRETFFVVVEHLDGGSLRDVLDRGRTLSPSQTLSIGLDVLRALEIVHRAGLIHGDVRPSTIVFGHDRQLKLIDVGLGQLLARMLWSDVVHVSNERAMYAAPEVASREPAVPKSDVYSLSLTMLECVTGHLPFVGDSTVATLSNRVGRLLPVSADLGALASVLERAGRPDPEGRFTVAEFGQALVRTAPKLPRPAPIPVLGGGLFDRESTRPLTRAAPDAGASLPSSDGGTATSSGDAPAETPAGGPPAPTPADASPLTDPLVAAASSVAGAAPQVDPVVDGVVSQPDDAGTARPAPDDSAGPGAEAGSADEVGDAPPVASEPENDALPWATKLPTGTPAPLPPPGAHAQEPGDDLPATQAVPFVASRDPGDGLPPTEAVPFVASRDSGDGLPPTQAVPFVPPAGRGDGLPPTQAVPFVTAAPTEAIRAVGGPPLEPTHVMPKVAATSITSSRVATPPNVTIYDEEPVGDHRRSRRWWFVPILLVLAAAGGAVAYFVTRTVSHAVPQLTGLSQGAALNEVSGNGWKTVLPQEASETVAIGQVIRTDPVAGTKLAEGKVLTIVVSTGPAPRPLPELRGQTLDAATAQLTALGLKIEQVDAVFDDAVPAGSVVSWNVPDQPNLVAGNTVIPGIVVRVQLSKGPPPTLPEITGLTLDAATQALAAQQLKITQGPPAYDETAPVGQVLSWAVPGRPDLVAGARVDPGVVVRVVLSQGPPPRPAPALAGRSAIDAQAAVESLGLVFARLPDEFSPTVVAGTVIRQDPAPGTAVPKGGTISVAVSKGPDVVAIPDVTNQLLQPAQDALSGAGLAVGTVTGNPTGVVTALAVAGTPVAPGQMVPRNTPVDLTLT